MIEHAAIDPAMVDWLEAHADEPIAKRAWLLASGLGDKQDKLDHIQDLIQRLRGDMSRLSTNSVHNPACFANRISQSEPPAPQQAGLPHD
jgi:hypothetical protein